jgi:hypothetical protein
MKWHFAIFEDFAILRFFSLIVWWSVRTGIISIEIFFMLWYYKNITKSLYELYQNSRRNDIYTLSVNFVCDFAILQDFWNFRYELLYVKNSRWYQHCLLLTIPGTPSMYSTVHTCTCFSDPYCCPPCAIRELGMVQYLQYHTVVKNGRYSEYSVLVQVRVQ